MMMMPMMMMMMMMIMVMMMMMMMVMMMMMMMLMMLVMVMVMMMMVTVMVMNIIRTRGVYNSSNNTVQGEAMTAGHETMNSYSRTDNCEACVLELMIGLACRR